MTIKETMAQLQSMGTAQNVKIYKRHGAGDNQFGVSFADLGSLKKKIKTDHALAVQLWETQNTDAQALATMIIDPSKLTATAANKWVNGIQYYLLSDLISGVIAKTAHAKKSIEKWMASKKELVRASGYSGLASMLQIGHDQITDADCKKYLKTIAKEIHSSPNRARHSMNGALIAVGVFRPHLSALAISAAEKIGKVEVDHGETSCKTPQAIPYIQKALKRKPKRVHVKC